MKTHGCAAPTGPGDNSFVLAGSFCHHFSILLLY